MFDLTPLGATTDRLPATHSIASSDASRSYFVGVDSGEIEQIHGRA